MKFETKKILILGAGFSGLNLALGLRQKLPSKEVKISIADKRGYHLFYPELFSILIFGTEGKNLEYIKSKIAIPSRKMLEKEGIEYIEKQVLSVDVQKKQVNFTGKVQDYDFLVVAMGSVPDMGRVVGVKEFAMPFKSFPDALRIRNRLEFLLENEKFSMARKPLEVVIIGGGDTGIEIASALATSQGLTVSTCGVKIKILQKDGYLSSNCNKKLDQAAEARLKHLGVQVLKNFNVVAVDKDFVYGPASEPVSYDLLIWAGGARAAEVEIKGYEGKNNRGQLPVDEYLRVKNLDGVFSLGDSADFGLLKQNITETAQAALQEARYLSCAIPIFLQNKIPPPFVFKKHGYILEMGKWWSIFGIQQILLTGIWGHGVKVLARLRYKMKFWF